KRYLIQRDDPSTPSSSRLKARLHEHAPPSGMVTAYSGYGVRWPMQSMIFAPSRRVESNPSCTIAATQSKTELGSMNDCSRSSALAANELALLRLQRKRRNSRSILMPTCSSPMLVRPTFYCNG